MNKETGPSRAPGRAAAQAAAAAEGFAWSVELWDMGRTQLEKVLGRASSVEVASAIFEAAVQDYPYRLVVLRRGTTLVRSTE